MSRACSSHLGRPRISPGLRLARVMGCPKPPDKARVGMNLLNRPFFGPQTDEEAEWQRPYFTISHPPPPISHSGGLLSEREGLLKLPWGAIGHDRS